MYVHTYEVCVHGFKIRIHTPSLMPTLQYGNLIPQLCRTHADSVRDGSPLPAPLGAPLALASRPPAGSLLATTGASSCSSTSCCLLPGNTQRQGKYGRQERSNASKARTSYICMCGGGIKTIPEPPRRRSMYREAASGSGRWQSRKKCQYRPVPRFELNHGSRFAVAGGMSGLCVPLSWLCPPLRGPVQPPRSTTTSPSRTSIDDAYPPAC